MKKIFTFIAAVLLTASVWAQSPEKMSYQAVIRNSSDDLVTNQQVGMQISILQNSATGNAVYVETQNATTNANGLISLEIGADTVVSGDFAAIDWANGPYFIKTETVPDGATGGITYTITGTSQLLSVPYALHAKTAETVTGGIVENDPIFSAWDKSTGISITESQISDLQTYITRELDPNFAVSIAAGITGADTATWNAKIGEEVDPYAVRLTGDQIIAGNKIFTDSIIVQTVRASNVTASNVTATLDANYHIVTNVADPVLDKDAANKAYVDALEAHIAALEKRIAALEGIIPPTVTTAEVTSITSTTATCGGNVTSDGGFSVTARGVC